MASEVIKLNLIPKGEMPVFHASQFDQGRLITCELYRGEDAYSVPSGYTVELHCRKVDNNIVTMASTSISDNVVTFTSTEQLTACNGKNLCEVAILDEGYRIGTLNFILEVEIDPLKGGINSTSEIHNLETQVEEITTEIVGENYYTKTETDTKLALKANAADVYTKTQVDTALALKANAADVYTKSQTDTLLNAKADSDSVYTKGQTDTLLSEKASIAYVDGEISAVDSVLIDMQTGIDRKADASDVYTKEQTYTQAEVNALIDNIFPTFTVSGNVATFSTALTKPLVSITTAEGATTVTRCGANLMHVNSRVSQQTYQGVTYSSDDNYMYMNGTKYGSTYANFPSLNVTLPAGTYYIKAFPISGTATNVPSIMPYNGSDLTSNILNNERILTLSETTTFHFRFALWTDNTVFTNYKIGIAISTAPISNYSEYTGTTVPVADADDITTIAGVNNIYTDAGQVTVQYKYMSL